MQIVEGIYLLAPPGTQFKGLCRSRENMKVYVYITSLVK